MDDSTVRAQLHARNEQNMALVQGLDIRTKRRVFAMIRQQGLSEADARSVVLAPIGGLTLAQFCVLHLLGPCQDTSSPFS